MAVMVKWVQSAAHIGGSVVGVKGAAAGNR